MFTALLHGSTYFLQVFYKLFTANSSKIERQTLQKNDLMNRIQFTSRFNPFAPAAKSVSDRPENLHMGWKKIINKNTF